MWDENQETAVQSPLGGTKIAWGGRPITPVVQGRQPRLLLVPLDGVQESEADRLVARGAVRLGVATDGAVVLADPDGNEFLLLTR